MELGIPICMSERFTLGGMVTSNLRKASQYFLYELRELAATLISITLGVGIDYQNDDQELPLLRRSGGR